MLILKVLLTCCTDTALGETRSFPLFFLFSLKYVSDLAFPATLKEVALLHNSFTHTRARARARARHDRNTVISDCCCACVILIMGRQLHASVDVAATCTHAPAVTVSTPLVCPVVVCRLPGVGFHLCQCAFPAPSDTDV